VDVKGFITSGNWRGKDESGRSLFGFIMGGMKASFLPFYSAEERRRRNSLFGIRRRRKAIGNAARRRRRRCD
jgi:hypothetical protein